MLVPLYLLNSFTAVLYAQVVEVSFPLTKYIIAGVAGLIFLAAIIAVVYKSLRGTVYDIDGVYGGGPGLRRVFRHKKLKLIDREGWFRGKSIGFKDPELERLLAEDNLNEATKYLTGVLRAAKESGDKYTRQRYAKYSEEIIGRYDKLEEEEEGGKAVHLKK